MSGAIPSITAACIEGNTRQLGDIVGQQKTTPAFSDTVGDAQPSLDEFRSQTGDQYPAGKHGDEGADQQNDQRGREKNFVFQTGVLQPRY